MGKFNTLPDNIAETATPKITTISDHSRSRLATCLSGVETVANTGGYIAGRVAKIGLKTSAAVVRGLLS